MPLGRGRTGVFLPHVIEEALTGLVVALAILSEGDHPQNAAVYALVYSGAPKFGSKHR